MTSACERILLSEQQQPGSLPSQALSETHARRDRRSKRVPLLLCNTVFAGEKLEAHQPCSPLVSCGHCQESII